MDEKELIEKSLQGEENAFGALVLQNETAVYRHCLSIVKDEEIAKDLTQETFVHAFQHLSSFRMQSRFSTWLWRIAHNLSLNYIKRERHMSQEFKETLFPSEVLEKKEIDEDVLFKIQKAMEHLPSKQRIVFELYDLKHVPQKEIAAMLGISLGTVRSRLFYARKRIKRLLQGIVL